MRQGLEGLPSPLVVPTAPVTISTQHSQPDLIKSRRVLSIRNLEVGVGDLAQ